MSDFGGSTGGPAAGDADLAAAGRAQYMEVPAGLPAELPAGWQVVEEGRDASGSHAHVDLNTSPYLLVFTFARPVPATPWLYRAVQAAIQAVLPVNAQIEAHGNQLYVYLNAVSLIS